MISKLHFPSPPLNRFIQFFYYYTEFEPPNEIDRLLPDGNVQLLFELTENPKPVYDNTTLEEIQICKRAWFSGFRTTPITIPSGKESEMMIVQFQKGSAFPFLSVPMQTVKNLVVDADLVFGHEIIALRDRLVETCGIGNKFQLLEAFFQRKLFTVFPENPFVKFVVAEIEKDPSGCRLKKVADDTGYSHKHMIKIFKDHVGVTPKEYLKVIRFQKAINELETTQQINWISLAYDCGYYDQSHLIADFKNFSGYTPLQYMAQKGNFLNYIPVR